MSGLAYNSDKPTQRAVEYGVYVALGFMTLNFFGGALGASVSGWSVAVNVLLPPLIGWLMYRREYLPQSKPRVSTSAS